MKHLLTFIIFACFFLSACNSPTPTVSTEVITIQYTAAAVPWLAGLYDCAGTNVVSSEQRAANHLDLQSTNLAIRIGLPKDTTFPVYQIGEEEILLIVNPQNKVTDLATEQARGLFTGQLLDWQEVNGSREPVQVWVYSPGEDVQQIFEQTLLGGSPVTSTARLATGPDEMVQAVASDVNAVGILTGHWKMDNVSEIYNVGTVPVLALSAGEPQGVVQEILACLQK